MGKMNRAMIVIFVSLVGAIFLVAKLNPCLAKEQTCSKKTFSSDAVVPIITYSPEQVEQSLKDGKRVVLFFQASWCSTCYLIEKDFQANAQRLPEDLVIYRVNIDTSKELKAKYNVVAQDELVQINTRGDEISHWKSSQRAVDELLTHLK